MSYQPCRWYDPYPRLAYALKLLYFSSSEQSAFAIQQLSEFLDHYQNGTDSTGTKVLLQKRKRQLSLASNTQTDLKNRWYDQSGEISSLIERIKQSPDFMKNRLADRLISLLTQSSLKGIP
ncbi:MAG: hypothetical protein K2X66_05305 [Cyanobacteria bacterium]|nr:hypothetical protein [Cyanobacteriota bacterium]